jgi:peptidoglycan/LPS O-acetylase OafA/YrhL
MMGHYFKKYVPVFSWKKTLSFALPLWIVGYVIIAGGFWYLMPKEFPIHESIDLAKDMETTWTYCSFGVVLTTMAYFLIARKFTADGWVYQHLIVPLSRLSYGIYLVHIFVLGVVFSMVSSWFSALDPWISTPLIIPCSALITFAISALITKLISYLPGNKYIIG